MSNTGNTQYGIGILFLLTGGIFLYVATMHVFPEVLGPVHEHQHEHEHEPNSGRDQNQNEAREAETKEPEAKIHTATKLCLIMVGLAFPLLLTLAIPSE